MTKSELIEAVAKKAKLSKKDAKGAVEAVIQTITSELKSGRKIRLTGFGTFEARMRKASIRRNPTTGAKLNVPAKRVPKFKASKSLKEAVRK